MKKLFVVLAVAAFCFGTTSCKKDCICSGTVKSEVSGLEPITTSIPSTNVGKMSKADCEAYKYPYETTVPGATVTVDVTCKAE
jgi:hypothetical protein